MQVLYGVSTFQSSHSVKIVHENGDETIISSNKILIANGSRPVFPKTIQPDGKRIFSFQNLYELTCFPSTMIVIGDGFIGNEMVNLFNQLNIGVT